jgi:hypothetical protein
MKTWSAGAAGASTSTANTSAGRHKPQLNIAPSYPTTRDLVNATIALQNLASGTTNSNNNNNTFVVSPRDGYGTSTAREPQEPDMPKPSGSSASPFKKPAANKYQPPATFTHQKLASTVRFPLVEELDDMVAEGLKVLEFTAYQHAHEQQLHLQTASDDNTINNTMRSSRPVEKFGLPVARLDVYRNAFQRFIEEMNLYQPFLMSVKREYDAVIEVLYDKYTEGVRIAQTIEDMEKSHTLTLAELTSKQKNTVNALKQDIIDLQLQLSIQQRENNKLQQDLNKQVEVQHTLQSEATELKSSCTLLTNSLVRMEEERKVLVVWDAMRAVDLNSAAFTSMKSAEEMEKYGLLFAVCCSFVRSFYY